MAPGPRKKNFNRKGGESGVEPKKNLKVNTERPAKEIKNVSNKDDLDTSDTIDISYNKQSLASNWDRYEEPVQDPHADTMRGEDFAVLSSYCGGSESQLQLQEEREWEENVCDKSVTINLQELIKAVKSVPFHKQIGVPSDIFNEKQLSKFETLSESYSDSLEPKADKALPIVSSDKTFMKEPETLSSDSNVIESYEAEEVEIEAPAKVVVLEEKTESIIESLASCLSLKDSVPEKSVKETQVEDKKISAIPDDLDFLLSLSVSTKNEKQGVEKNKKQTNVDDWLNSILDD